MTDEQIRIAVAEACGIRVTYWVFQWLSGDKLTWVRSSPFINERTAERERLITKKRGPVSAASYEQKLAHNLPDYLNDLNACHEMEETLTDPQKINYYETLSFMHKKEYGLVTDQLFQIAHSSARGRCETFLRTHGKWTEEGAS